MGIILAKLPSTYQTLRPVLYTNQALDWDMAKDQIRSFHGYENLDAKLAQLLGLLRIEVLVAVETSDLVLGHVPVQGLVSV